MASLPDKLQVVTAANVAGLVSTAREEVKELNVNHTYEESCSPLCSCTQSLVGTSSCVPATGLTDWPMSPATQQDCSHFPLANLSRSSTSKSVDADMNSCMNQSEGNLSGRSGQGCVKPFLGGRSLSASELCQLETQDDLKHGAVSRMPPQEQRCSPFDSRTDKAGCSSQSSSQGLYGQQLTAAEGREMDLCLFEGLVSAETKFFFRPEAGDSVSSIIAEKAGGHLEIIKEWVRYLRLERERVVEVQGSRTRLKTRQQEHYDFLNKLGATLRAGLVNIKQTEVQLLVPAEAEAAVDMQRSSDEDWDKMVKGWMILRNEYSFPDMIAAQEHQQQHLVGAAGRSKQALLPGAVARVHQLRAQCQHLKGSILAGMADAMQAEHSGQAESHDTAAISTQTSTVRSFPALLAGRQARLGTLQLQVAALQALQSSWDLYHELMNVKLPAAKADLTKLLRENTELAVQVGDTAKAAIHRMAVFKAFDERFTKGIQIARGELLELHSKVLEAEHSCHMAFPLERSLTEIDADLAQEDNHYFRIETLRLQCLINTQRSSRSTASATGVLQVDVRPELNSLRLVIFSIARCDLSGESLQACLQQLKGVHTVLSNFVQEWVQPNARVCLRSEDECSSTQHKPPGVVEDLLALLVELVAELETLSTRWNLEAPASDIERTAEDLFWRLWGLLGTICLTYKMITLRQPSICLVKQHPSVHTAFLSLLNWLLGFTQSPAWLLISSDDAFWQRREELATILEQPARCLLSISTAPTLPILIDQVALLSPEFLPMLCCIASEHLGKLYDVATNSPLRTSSTVYTSLHTSTAPTSIAHLPFVLSVGSTLVCSIDNLLISKGSMQCDGIFPQLRAPAVLQLLKVILALPLESTASVQDLWRRCLCCLNLLLCTCQAKVHTDACLGHPLSSYDREVNRNALGLPFHADPLDCKQVLQTDTKLMHTLGIHTVDDGPSSAMRLYTQHLILETWSLAHGDLPTPASAAHIRAALQSVVHIARQCTSHALQLMRRQTTNGLNGPAQPRQQGVRRNARLRDSKLEALGPEGTEMTRSLMFDVSRFTASRMASMVSPKDTKLSALRTWSTDAGWAAATEMLMRSSYQPIKFWEADQTSRMAPMAVEVVLECSSMLPVLWLNVSFASTLQKMICFQIRSHVHGSSTQMQCPWLPANIQMGISGNGEKGIAVGLLRTVILALNRTLLAPDGDKFSGSQGTCSSSKLSSGRGSSDSGKRRSHARASVDHAAACQHTGQRVQQIARVSARTAQSCPKTPSRQGLTHQVMAILVSSLVQTCLGGVDVTGVATHDWLTEVSHACSVLVYPDLKTMVATLVSEPPTSPAEAGGQWERYAVTHFNGRLLPGCCNMGCTNLDGVSEAALKTQLCSGCRRVRYCSVECQRAAWLGGGHSSVCLEGAVGMGRS